MTVVTDVGLRRAAAGPYVAPPTPSPRGAAVPRRLASPFLPTAEIDARVPSIPVRPRSTQRRIDPRARRRAASRIEVGYEEWAGGAAVRALSSHAAPVPSIPSPDEPITADGSSLRTLGAPYGTDRDRVAILLTALATRVRAGGLGPLTLTADMSDAAIVAAVLTAMLTKLPHP